MAEPGLPTQSLGAKPSAHRGKDKDGGGNKNFLSSGCSALWTALLAQSVRAQDWGGEQGL